jgi:hypothetical protein
MTGTPFNDDLAGAELMLRERFEDAVGAMSPDIGRLVAEGTADGRGALRRRRVLSGIAAAAVAVITVGSITYASQSDLFGLRNDNTTDQEQLIPLEAATPRGLAAAVMAHTTSLGDPFAVGGETTNDHGKTLTVSVAYQQLDGVGGMELDVYATDQVPTSLTSCEASASPEVTSCVKFTLPDGTPAVYAEYGSLPKDNGIEAFAALVAAVRNDQVVAAFETMSGSRDLLLDRHDLAAIVADPAVGLSTTAALNAVGDDIPDFKLGGLITNEVTESGGGSAPPPSEAPTRQPDATGGSGSSPR